MTIDEKQEEIVKEFSLLDGDQEMTIYYVMELGQKLPTFSESDRKEENEVKGCQSKVWMTAKLENEKMILSADSNTAITKGLVSLLVRIFSGQRPNDILLSELTFMKRIGMERFIGTQRSNGFAAMIKQIKMYAFAFKTQLAN
ncbi:MAG: SufE family protein [Chryseotalea sp. WA131a]|jgi:cysteine desulfuration protein SufE|nr:MAG: SufE family protein [Chryseotalea sp. WA131a]